MGRVPTIDPTQKKSKWQELLVWLARQRPFTWFLIHVGNRIDPALMRVSGGRLKSTLTAPTVVLTHTGARTGQIRKTPLAYFTVEDDVILIASRGGHERHPAWYRNVTANPDVELWTGGGGGRYRAREAEGAERERLWNLATTMYQGFGDYQERAAARRIPVIVCSPLEG